MGHGECSTRSRTVPLLAVLATVMMACAGLVLTAGPAAAAQWIRTGGPLGGLGYDVRMHPDNPDRMYVTDAFAGVFISNDGGHNWHPSNQGITVRAGETGDAIPVFCLTVDPHDPNVIWAGTQYLRGIFRSTDGGRTWHKRDNGVVEADGVTFRGFTVDPRSPDIVYAAAEVSSWVWSSDGEPRQGREFDLTQGVVYKTTDGGANWSAIWRGDNLARYVWIDPRDPNVLYVSTGIFDREAANSDPDSRRPGGEGIVKSTDGGKTWRNVNRGLDNLYVGTLYMHPGDPDILLAGTGNNQYWEGSGAYLTDDGGAIWRRTLDTGAAAVTSVEFSETEPNVAYAGSADRVYRSVDGGRTWLPITGLAVGWGPPGVRAGFPIDFQVDPRDADRIFANNYGGGNFVSQDGGRSWAGASKGYTGAQVRDIAVDPGQPGRVFAAARSGLFKSLNGGTDWQGQNHPPAYRLEWNAVAINPSNPQHVVAGDNWDKAIAVSNDGGASWRVPLRLEGERYGVRALAFAPSDPDVIYAGFGGYESAGSFSHGYPGKGVYVSRDGGVTWGAVNDSNSENAHVTDIAVHPGDSRIVYAATSRDGVLSSSNGGISWQTLPVPSPPGMGLRAVTIDPVDPDTVFVGGGAGLYRTDDGGSGWRHLVSGFAPESFVSDIVIDPTDPTEMYASDLFSGVMRSTDGGETWTAVNDGLTNKAVNRLGLSADGRTLYAATEGMGVFRLDLSGGSPPGATEPRIFADVSPTNPYRNAILALFDRDIVSGYPPQDGTSAFKPANPLWRAQFAKMVVGALGLPVDENARVPFTDLGPDRPDDLYPHQFVAVAAQHGITRGTTATTFSPYTEITRAQVITMAVRSLERYPHVELREPGPLYEGSGFLARFTDPTHGRNVRVAEWNGLLDGLELRDWDPWRSATREEVAQVLWQVFQKVHEM